MQTEEDRRLKESLEEALEELKSGNLQKQRKALNHIRKEILESTTTMTSVPRPLKFLLPHYDELKHQYQVSISTLPYIPKEAHKIHSADPLTCRSCLKMKH